MTNDRDRMTALDALIDWCATYLESDDYKIVPESRSYCATVYFTDCGIGYLCFDRSGQCCGMGALDEEEMYEHINEYERDHPSES